jgi:hypothetical protein
MFSLSATARVTFATVLPSQYTLVGLRFDRVLLGKLGTQKLQHYGPRPSLTVPLRWHWLGDLLVEVPSPYSGLRRGAYLNSYKTLKITGKNFNLNYSPTCGFESK